MQEYSYSVIELHACIGISMDNITQAHKVCTCIESLCICCIPVLAIIVETYSLI